MLNRVQLHLRYLIQEKYKSINNNFLIDQRVFLGKVLLAPIQSAPFGLRYDVIDMMGILSFTRGKIQ